MRQADMQKPGSIREASQEAYNAAMECGPNENLECAIHMLRASILESTIAIEDSLWQLENAIDRASGNT